MGANEERPDYDYTDGLELHVFRPEDGEITVKVPDLKGNVVATYTVTVKGGEVSVRTDSKKPYRGVVH